MKKTLTDLRRGKFPFENEKTDSSGNGAEGFERGGGKKGKGGGGSNEGDTMGYPHKGLDILVPKSLLKTRKIQERNGEGERAKKPKRHCQESKIRGTDEGIAAKWAYNRFSTIGDLARRGKGKKRHSREGKKKGWKKKGRDV